MLCTLCESKLESGQIHKHDVDGAVKMAKLAKQNDQINRFSLSACSECMGDSVISLSREDIRAIRQSRILYRMIQNEFPGKIWIVETNCNDRQFLEDLYFPTKILSVNSVWAPGGIEKTKVIVSGKWTAKFPIDTDKTVAIAKQIRNLDIIVEFERGGR